MKDGVSVIMAVHNGEDYLKESIASILNQTYQHFEFIIVNDGSTDKTKEILDSLADPRVKVYHLQQNCGVSYARNFAIGKAQNRWIVLQDDDDISAPTRIEDQLNYVKNHPDVISAISLFQFIGGRRGPFLTRKQLKSTRFFCPWICYGSAIISKEKIVQAGGYDERCRIGEDYDLFLQLLELGPIDMIPKILYYYRYDRNSTSRKSGANTRTSIIKIAVNHIKRMIEESALTPSFLLIGSVEDSKNFIETVCPETQIRIKQCIDYTNDEKLNQAYSLLKQNKAHGIIVLADSKHGRPVLKKLIGGGMTLNKDLFYVKNFKKMRATS